MSDMRSFRTSITNAVRAVDRLRKLIDDNGGDAKITLTFCKGEWSGGYKVESTGQLAENAAKADR